MRNIGLGQDSHRWLTPDDARAGSLDNSFSFTLSGGDQWFPAISQAPLNSSPCLWWMCDDGALERTIARYSREH